MVCRFEVPPPPAPQVANQDPDKAGHHCCRQDGESNKYMEGINHDEGSAYRVEAIESGKRLRQGEQIVFPQFEDVFTRMVLGLPRERLSARIAFDMSPQDIADRAVANKLRRSFRAREIS